MTQQCILNAHKRDGCATCPTHCQHRLALHGLNGEGGRVANVNVPRKYRHVTLDNAPPKVDQARTYRQLKHYVATFERMFDAVEAQTIKSLYLWSAATGTGKTTTAVALLNYWLAVSYVGALKRGEQPAQSPAYFHDVNEWQTDYNAFNRPRVPDAIAEPASARYYRAFERAKYAPFAVLDDIGVRDATEGFRGDLHTIINYRVTEGLPTVYTSNIPLEDSTALADRVETLKPYDLRDIYDVRLFDRVRDACMAFHFEGQSQRGRKQ